MDEEQQEFLQIWHDFLSSCQNYSRYSSIFHRKLLLMYSKKILIFSLHWIRFVGFQNSNTGQKEGWTENNTNSRSKTQGNFTSILWQERRITQPECYIISPSTNRLAESNFINVSNILKFCQLNHNKAKIFKCKHAVTVLTIMDQSSFSIFNPYPLHNLFSLYF